MISGFQQATGAQARLVCFPRSRRRGEFYRTATRMLAPEVDVLVVRYPRGALEAGDARALASRALPSVRALTGLPVCLLGHGPSVLVAFEVARLMHVAGEAPQGLVVAAGGPPRRPGSGADGRQGWEPSSADDGRTCPGSASRSREVPVTRLCSPILALAGEGDPAASVEQMSVWAQHTSDEFHLEIFDAGPGFLDVCATTVATAIRDRIMPPPTGELRRK